MWTAKVSEMGSCSEVTGGEKHRDGHSGWKEAERVSGGRPRKHRHSRLKIDMKWGNGVGGRYEQNFSLSHPPLGPKSLSCLVRPLSSQAGSSLLPPGGCFKDFTKAVLGAGYLHAGPSSGGQVTQKGGLSPELHSE